MKFSYNDMQKIRKMKGWKKWVYALKYIWVDYEALNQWEKENERM